MRQKGNLEIIEIIAKARNEEIDRESYSMNDIVFASGTVFLKLIMGIWGYLRYELDKNPDNLVEFRMIISPGDSNKEA